MTAGEKLVLDKARDIGVALEPDAMGAVKRLLDRHDKMTDARDALEAMDPSDPTDPAFIAADDEYDVQRGLWYEAVELEAKNFGVEVLTEIIKAIGAYLGA